MLSAYRTAYNRGNYTAAEPHERFGPGRGSVGTFCRSRIRRRIFWNLLGMRPIRAVLFFSPIINDIAAVSRHSQDRKLLALQALECIKDGLAKAASLISQELGGPLCKGRSGAFPEIQVTEKTFVNEFAD